MKKLLAMLPLVLGALMVPDDSEASCVTPTDETPVTTHTLAATALGALSAHPTPDLTTGAQSGTVTVFDSNNYTMYSDFSASSAVVSGTNLVQMDDGTYRVFFNTTDGEIESWDPQGLFTAAEWTYDTSRGGCSDHLSSGTLLQLRRYSSDAFKAMYTNDVLFALTRYGSGCAGYTTDNQLIAIDAMTGALLWEFNSDKSNDVDAIYGSPTIDIATDTIFFGTDQTDPLADSLYAVDSVSGVKKWSSNHGPIWTAPRLTRDGSQLFITTTGGVLKLVSATIGTTVWAVSNGGTPYTADHFAEFRAPFDDLIVTVDYDGVTRVFRNDIYYGTLVFTVTGLIDPDKMTPPAAVEAAGPAVIDAANGRLFLSAKDGHIYQLSAIDGTVQATRNISVGASTVGSLTLSFDDEGGVEIAGGASTGEITRYCEPWATMAGTSFKAQAYSSEIASFGGPNPGLCTTPANCGPDPTVCSTWACVDQVCIPTPLADGIACTPSAPAQGQSVHECNAGVCLGYTDCQLGPETCNCDDGIAGTFARGLLVDHPTCQGTPLGSQFPNWCGAGVSATLTQDRCFDHGALEYGIVSVHLEDARHRPINVGTLNGSSISFTITGGDQSSTKPTFIKPGTSTSVGDVATLAAATVIGSSEAGTYYAIVSGQADGNPSSSGTPWRIEVAVNHTDTGGDTCVDIGGSGGSGEPLLSVDFLMGDATSGQACPLDSNKDMGNYVWVKVVEDKYTDPDTGSQIYNEAIQNAEVQVGYARNPNAYARNYEEAITASPTGDNYGTTDASGEIVIRGWGNYFVGPIHVFATCPGGSIDESDPNVVPKFADVRWPDPTVDPWSSTRGVITLDCKN